MYRVKITAEKTLRQNAKYQALMWEKFSMLNVVVVIYNFETLFHYGYRLKQWQPKETSQPWFLHYWILVFPPKFPRQIPFIVFLPKKFLKSTAGISEITTNHCLHLVVMLGATCLTHGSALPFLCLSLRLITSLNA